MPTIINPYANDKTMGADLFGIGGIADAFFGPKASTAAFTREKFKEQQRQNEATLALPGAIISGDPNNIVRQGIWSGQTPQNTYGYRQGYGVSQPGIDLATPQGQKTVSTLQMAVPGTAFTSTPMGQSAALQNARDTTLMQQDKVILADQLKNNREIIDVLDPSMQGGYRSITRQEFLDNPGRYSQVMSQDRVKGGLTATNFGNLPSLDINQRKLLGAEPAGAAGQNFYITDPVSGQVVDEGITLDDGRTRVDNNSPTGSSPIQVPPGHRIGLRGTANPSSASGLSSGLRPTQAGNLDENIIAGEDAIRLTKQVIQMAQSNPQIVGPSGNVLRAGQTATDLVASVQSLLGGRDKADIDLTRARQTVMQTLGPNAAQIFPELFSGDLSQIETLHGLLTYKVARALNKGGTLSNMDVEKARHMIGDPTAWTQGPTGFLQKMTATQQQLELELADNMKRRQTNRASVNPTVPPGATGAPGVAAPPPPPGFVPD